MSICLNTKYKETMDLHIYIMEILMVILLHIVLFFIFPFLFVLLFRLTKVFNIFLFLLVIFFPSYW